MSNPKRIISFEKTLDIYSADPYGIIILYLEGIEEPEPTPLLNIEQFHVLSHLLESDFVTYDLDDKIFKTFREESIQISFPEV